MLFRGTILTVAGAVDGGYSGDGGPATKAHLLLPNDIAVDSSGILYIADLGNYRVRKVCSDGRMVSVAGVGIPGYRGDGGPASSGMLARPFSIALDREGSLFIACPDNRRIRKISLDATISTVAGSGPMLHDYFGAPLGVPADGDGGSAVDARMHFPGSVALDRDGCLLIADARDHRIRKVDAEGIIQTVVGIGPTHRDEHGRTLGGFAGDGGLATRATLNGPTALTVDCKGSLYIADSANYRVRKVDPDGTITTLAGNGEFGFGGDNGDARQAQLGTIGGIAVDCLGNLYIADYDNRRVRRVSEEGIIVTVAGNGDWQPLGDGGPAIEAGLDNPTGLTIDSEGNLYISDSGNNRICKAIEVAAPGLLAGWPFI